MFRTARQLQIQSDHEKMGSETTPGKENETRRGPRHVTERGHTVTKLIRALPFVS